jgi:hypothetical protein
MRSDTCGEQVRISRTFGQLVRVERKVLFIEGIPIGMED